MAKRRDSFSTVEEVQALVERLVPDPALRVLVLSLFADSVDYIHAWGAAKWGAYCDSEHADRVRLLCGHPIVFTLHKEGVWLSLDAESIKLHGALDQALGEARGWHLDDGTAPGGYGDYERPPSKNIYYRPGAEHDRSWPAIAKLHFAYLDTVARKFGALYVSSQDKHQPALLAYLRRALGRELPDPVYQASDEAALRSAHEPASALSLLDATAEALDQSDEFDFADAEDARRRVMASIVRRQGQPRFRQVLIELYGGTCAFSGCSLMPILDAAHIQPYRGAPTNDPRNGLLLRTDLHTLFDLHLLAVDTVDMTIIVAPSLRSTEYASLSGAKVRHPSDPRCKPSGAALDAHREQFDTVHSSRKGSARRSRRR